MAIDNQFGKGIGVAAGFDLGAQKPLDARVAVNTIAERDAHVTENRAYEGMLVFVDETKLTYQLVNGEWKEFGFNQSDFEESFADAIKETNNRLVTLEGLVVGGEGEGIQAVIADVAANKTAIDKLNGAADAEGSVAKAVADEAKLREQADNSLDNRIAAFETNGANDVAALADRVEANENKLAGLEEGCTTVQAAIDKAEADAKAHAEQKIADLVDSAPDAMNTLNELAKAINDNKGVYDAWVIEHNQAMAQQKADLQAEIDADVKVEKERAEGQEELIRQEMANAIGNYAVEADPENGIEAQDASGLRKEIAEADAAIRQEMADAVANIHNHDNKAILDGIDAAKVAAWDGAQAAAEAKAAELDATLKADLQKEIDDDVKVVQDELDKQKDAEQEGTLAKQIADVNARLDQNGDIEDRIAQNEANIDGLQGLVGQPAQAGEGEEEGVPATGLHLALDNAKAELDQAILDEKERAESAEGDLQDAIDALIEKVGHGVLNEGSVDEEEATGLEARIIANETFVAAQPAIDQEQDRRLTELESFKNAMNQESEGLAGRIETLEDANKEGGAVANAIAAAKKAGDDAQADVDAVELRVDALEAKVGHDIDGDQPATGLFLEVDEAKAAAQQAQNEVDAVEGRVVTLETFKNEHSHEQMEADIAANKAAIEAEVGKEGVQGARDAAIAAAIGQHAAEGVEASGLRKEIDDAVAVEKGRAEGQESAIRGEFAAADTALHAAIKGEMAAVIQSLVAEITVEGKLRIALGGIEGDEVLVIREQEIPFVTDDEIDAIIDGLDAPAEQG